MNRMLLLGAVAFAGLAGTAEAKDVVIRCNMDGMEQAHATYEWNTEKTNGIEVERQLYMGFRESGSSVYITYLAGPGMGAVFRLDKSELKLFIDPNKTPVGSCSISEAKSLNE